MLRCHGLLRIPNDHGASRSKWKDGFYLSFKAFAVGSGRQHYYRCNMFVSREEIDQWEKDIKPGAIFLLENGGVESYSKEEWKNSIYTIKIQRKDLKLLRVKPIGEKDE
jgi:hypothetical protein